MPPRRSRRDRKSTTVQTYHFGSSSDEEVGASVSQVADGQAKQDVEFEARNAPRENDDDHVIVDAGYDEALRRGKGRKIVRGRQGGGVGEEWRVKGEGARCLVAQPFLTDVVSVRQGRDYHGPVKRSALGLKLVRDLYGPAEEDLGVVAGVLERWRGSHVLPRRGGLVGSPWVGEGFWEAMGRRMAVWEGRSGVGRWEGVEKGGYVGVEKAVVMVVGPVGGQREVEVMPGEGFAVGHDGLPVELGGACAGWILDTGGLVFSVDWAPFTSDRDQILAVAVQPFGLAEDPPPVTGTIQLWSFSGCKNARGEILPIAQKPKRLTTICMDYGAAKKVAWCPVPSTVPGRLGFLAVLCADGAVYVLDVPEQTGTSFRKHPLYIKPN